MKEFVEYLIKNLVDYPESVNIQCFEGDRGIVVEIRVAQTDIGKIIGRHGNTIKALRTIVSSVSSRIGKHVRLELIEPEAAESSDVQES
jgi:predicted RNA-binding protein YlqC (UPF0109 family)